MAKSTKVCFFIGVALGRFTSPYRPRSMTCVRTFSQKSQVNLRHPDSLGTQSCFHQVREYPNCLCCLNWLENRSITICSVIDSYEKSAYRKDAALDIDILVLGALDVSAVLHHHVSRRHSEPCSQSSTISSQRCFSAFQRERRQ